MSDIQRDESAATPPPARVDSALALEPDADDRINHVRCELMRFGIRPDSLSSARLQAETLQRIIGQNIAAWEQLETERLERSRATFYRLAEAAGQPETTVLAADGDRVSGRGVNPRSPVLCEHANESPATCPCLDSCYCRAEHAPGSIGRPR